jgi:hypothetical protein
MCGLPGVATHAPPVGLPTPLALGSWLLWTLALTRALCPWTAPLHSSSLSFCLVKWASGTPHRLTAGGNCLHCEVPTEGNLWGSLWGWAARCGRPVSAGCSPPVWSLREGGVATAAFNSSETHQEWDSCPFSACSAIWDLPGGVQAQGGRPHKAVSVCGTGRSDDGQASGQGCGLPGGAVLGCDCLLYFPCGHFHFSQALSQLASGPGWGRTSLCLAVTRQWTRGFPGGIWALPPTLYCSVSFQNAWKCGSCARRKVPSFPSHARSCQGGESQA